MEKNKKQKEKPKIPELKSNPKIEEIVKDYPKVLKAHPRGNFEDQLKRHLIKHKVK